MEALHLVTWTVTSLLCVLSYEVTVRSSDLKLCEADDRVCVADLRDCGPRSPSSLQKALNMSCYYQESPRSMTCEWSEESDDQADADVSLTFSSTRRVLSCQRLFIPTARLRITARRRRSGVETWSQPHPVFLYSATKPPPPELGVGGSTADSVHVSWGSSNAASCRLRYRAADSQTWSEVPDVVSSPQDQKWVYTITGLQPSTVYTAAVACRRTSGLWSNWSPGVSAMTLQPAPSRSPQVCYRLENTDSGGRLLHLTLKALDSRDAEGRILGYQVTYGPATGRRPQDRAVVNVAEEAASLPLDGGNWSVSVAAFNAGGYGPAENLSVDALTPDPLPSVRNMWVSSSFPPAKVLTVQWTLPTETPPAAGVVCRWRVEAGGRWSTVAGATSPVVIRDVDPDESYHISVFTVSQHRCGSPQSLSASLRRGALVEPNNLKVIGANRTAATVTWAWKRKSGPIRVDGYRLELRSHSETQTQALWSDQSQHTFINLTPLTEYSLSLLADGVSTVIVSVRTHVDEGPPVATATPLLLLLAVAVLTVSILSRTVLKRLFLPRVSGPQDGTLGRWLMDPGRTSPAEPNILDIKDFQETDVLGVKSAIVVGPRCSDAAPLPLEPLVIKLSDLSLGSGCPAVTEHRPQSESRGVDPQIRDSLPSAPRGDDGQTPRQTRDGVRCLFLHLVAETSCSDHITCEEEYVGTVTRDTDYIPNMAALTRH